MLGADYYETDAESAILLAEGRVPVGIGENTKIKYKHIKYSPFSFSIIFFTLFIFPPHFIYI